MEMIEWKEQRFSDISTKEFYEIFKFRSEVFVVEQEILYNDFDYKDYKAIHLSGFINDKLMAYARIFDKGDYEKNFETKEIKISAQEYLEKFYLDLGFEFRGERYMEDGIPHCAMYYNK